MNEHKIILEDLQKYLKERGIEAEVYDENESPDLVIMSIKNWKEWNTRYTIANGRIVHYYIGMIANPVVSLSDPRYKEKFYEYWEKRTKEHKEVLGE